MLWIIAETLLQVAAGLACVALITGSFWALFKLIHHPEWGPPIGIALAILAFHEPLRHARLFSMVLIFGITAASFAWSEGAAWRDRRRQG